ncbi:MAG: hypothetical protein WD894_01445 [Pirellulales bacterium]
MSNFVVIDQSVKRIGGHNYEYALHVLTAAEREGYRPILTVNRRFFERQRLPACWQLYTPFRHTTYEAARLAAKQRQLDPDGVLTSEEANRLSLPAERRGQRSWIRALPAGPRRYFIRRYENIRRRIIGHYAEDLAQLFSALHLDRGDQVFVPTLSEDDLVGLLAFFRRHESSASQVTWHLQFHFSLYEGREPGYASQDARLLQLKQLFGAAASMLPPGCVHFYTTTEILADQYNRLGASHFQTLPYPVNPALLENRRISGDSGGPLRVTCAGGVRAEKGTQELYRSVAPLWRDYFESGRLQLVVQAKRLGKLPKELRRHARYDRESVSVNGAMQSPPRVAVIRWPLSTEKYLDLIRNSHIGLLLYDADQYYARCSGVMVEMLKAGVPVIVPAGCWMAEQIAEPIFIHRDRVCQTIPIVARLTPADADWEAGRAQRYYLWRRDARLLVGGQGAVLGTRLSVPQGASHLCVRFRWGTANAPGSYLELTAAQTGIAARPLQTTREIVGARTEGAAVPVLMALTPATKHVQLTWRNAFNEDALSLEDVEFTFLSAEAGACPLGAVGLVSAGVDQAARLLRDMADHYGHYRRTAEEFAPVWGEWHSPEKVVRLLTEAHAAEQRYAA